MNAWNAMLNALFPVQCAVCSGLALHGLLCDHCRERVSIPVTPPAGLAGCRSLGTYGSGLGKAIRRAKYDRNLFLIDELGLWLGRSVNGWAEVDTVASIPVPVHRLLFRGFDHGHRLARGVARVSDLPLCSLLARRNASRQVGQSAPTRKTLAGESFESTAVLDGQRVLLVDDVVTTGATLSAAAAVLKECGASEVWGLVVAHTERKGNCTDA
jgi:ComF family protein